MKTLVVALLILPIFAPAQSKLTVYTGANFPSTSVPQTFDDVLGEYWHPAFNVGVSFESPLAEWIAISPLVEYNHYSFNQFHEIIAPPMAKQSSGQASQVLRLLFEIKLFDRASNGNRVYVVTGLGYNIEKLGRIDVLWEGDGGPEYYSVLPFTGKDYWAHSLGIGYQFAIMNPLAIDLCAKYYSNYKDRFDISTNLGVVFAVGQ